MLRSALLTLGLLLLLTVPAPAQDQPQIGIGTAQVVSYAPVRNQGARVGDLTVSRDGSLVIALASFKGRPPGKKMSVCVTIAGGEQQCASKKARRNGTVKLSTTADFTTPLTARARSGGARGHLSL
jgi:hypothetical protein